MLELNRRKVPVTPGVYFFRDARGQILYVGKASNLRNRLGSYVRPGADLPPAKRRLLNEATRVTWETTTSEIEALLTEAHEIKKHQPPYNVLLRDDKTFLSVKITDEKYPRVLPTRKIEADGSTYFGPFTDARAVYETLKVLRRLFPYRTTCTPNSERRCLNAHLGLCPGVCAGLVSTREYRRTIRRLRDFLSGKRQRLVQELERQRRALARRRDAASLARAEKLAHQLRYLEKVVAMSRVLSFGEKAEGDVAELARALGLARRPRRIEGYDISNLMGQQATASLVVFTDGQADKSHYKRFKIKEVRGANDVAMLKETLRRRFINHASTTTSVAMAINLVATHKVEPPLERWPMPDLVVVDGGRPQLSAALQVWRELGLKIPLVSLAKRYEEVFTTASPDSLVLPRTSGALHLLQRVRDEAHRFAVSYHRLLRRKRLLQR